MTDLERLESLFFAALDRDPAARPAFLDEACGGDPALRDRVERLLAARHDAGDFLEGTAATGEFPADPAGDTLDLPGRDELVEAVLAGKYRLAAVIGEGGMGTVYRAQQTEPVKRTVAVKVIKAGMDSRAVLARFEAERQALALMDHPNIARVLDAGTTDAGRPFFVMELVAGVPITEFCDGRRLTPRQRLELFVPVCQAIQHAHQKGVIHRDIKPSNVLVTLYDDRPTPKVIDFGVAKATGPGLAESATMTGLGAVVGTPEYMSPEQASLNAVDIDTRSDVYSLGVLLYELLTGTTPVDRKALGKAALLEVLRIVREVETPRPSARLSAIDALPRVAAARGTEPATLSRLMKGELDWVLLKALEKDRARRYDTAVGLARDVQRYLADELVEARPPSAGYRLGKFVRRNRGRVLAAGLVLLALLGGIAGTTFGLIRAEKARADEARRAEGERVAKVEAQEKRAEAERQKARAEAGEKLAGERLVQVRAEQRKAEEEKRTATAVKNFLLNKLLGQADSWKQAIALVRSGRPATEAKPDLTVRELLDRAAGELSPARIEANFPEQPLLQAEILRMVGITYRGVRQPRLAIGFLERAAALLKRHRGADDPQTLNVLNQLALAYWVVGDAAQASKLLEENREAFAKTLGADHPFTLHLLARTHHEAGNLPRAIDLLEQARDAQAKKLGLAHVNTLTTTRSLAEAYRDAGQLPRALDLLLSACDTFEERFRPGHPQTLYTLERLAAFSLDIGKPARAIDLLEPALDFWVKAFGADHANVTEIRHLLARAYAQGGRPADAAKLVTGLIAAVRKDSPKVSPRGAEQLARCGSTLLEMGAHADAEPPLRDALAVLRKSKPDVWTTDHAATLLGVALLGQKKYAEAEPLLVAGYEGMKRREKAIIPRETLRLPEALDRLVELYAATDRAAEAAKWRAERARWEPRVSEAAAARAAARAVDDRRTRKRLAAWAAQAAAAPKDTALSLKVAALQAWFGQDGEWAATCARAVASAKGTADPGTAERAAKVCSLRPGDDEARVAAALTLARGAVERGKGHIYLPYFQMALGMAEYRAGNDAAADAALTAAATAFKDNARMAATSAFYRAMSLSRRGDAAEARRVAAEAAAKTKPLPADENNPLDGANADDLILWMAYKEARALIGFGR